MMTTRMSSKEFNRNSGGAKRAAASGPVYITDRGRPAHVLLTYDTYERLLGTNPLLDQLAQPAGVENIEFEVPVSPERPHPASFA